MQKKFKSGLLIFLLGGPLLLWLSLHLLGTNHYNIPKHYPLEVAENGDTLYHVIPDFKFINQNGEEVTLNDFEGKVFVANFFFTTCPTICPDMSGNIKYLQHAFRNHDDVMFISHTVNPDNDSVAVLKEYAKLYEAKSDKWHLVTGDKDKLYKQATDGYKVIASENDGFIHSEKLVLIDKNKNIRGYFNGTKEKEVEDLLGRIRILLYEQSK